MHRSTARIVVIIAGVTLGLIGSLVVPTTAAAEPASCSDVEVVAARGTYEFGPLGKYVGDPFYADLVADLPGKSVTAYSVNYPASVNPLSAALGNIDVVQHVNGQAGRCPDQKFVLVGFSQGANVISNALGVSSNGAFTGAPIRATLSPTADSQVAAVVLFGPPNGRRDVAITGPYADRTDEVCAPNDVICDPDGQSLTVHGSYNKSGLVDQGAAYAAARV